MKALMIYPQFPDTSFWKFNHALKFIGKKAAIPPMGLLTVAAMFPETWEVKLIDLNVEKLKDEDIIWADYVFISAMILQKESVCNIIEACHLHDRKIVAGGPLFTSRPQLFSEIDHLILNEAEVTLPQFLFDLEQGDPKPIYQSSKWADITSSPVPRWDLINQKNYASLSVQYSRGCPYNCDFCDITVLYGNRPRIKTVEAVLNELEMIYLQGWRGNVFFVDDNFIGNKKQLKEKLLPAVIVWMKKKKYPFRFQTQASIDIASDDLLLDLMIKAGFGAVFVGIETPDEECLAECGKTQNTKVDLLKSVKKLQSAGMDVQAGFIVGFDSDKTSIFSRMSQFINESGIVTSMVGLLNAPPGSKLYKRMVKEKRITMDATGDNTDLSMNFKPKMDYNVLVNGYKNIILDIFKPEAYYNRIYKFLHNYRCSSKFDFRRRFTAENVRAIGMAFYKLGIKSGVRKHFWKLMVWTTFNHPRSIPMAVQLSIYSYQYRKFYNL
jgi:radical SAM superfamily enzyme YgiQ (UPF0313 family)